MLREGYHRLIADQVNSGGLIILEGFSKSHTQYQSVNPKRVGPRDHQMLFTVDMIKEDFSDFDPILLVQKEVILNEGLYHDGQATVVRFLGRKRVV